MTPGEGKKSGGKKGSKKSGKKGKKGPPKPEPTPRLEPENTSFQDALASTVMNTLSTAAENAGLVGGVKGLLVQKGVEFVGEAIQNPEGVGADLYHKSKKWGNTVEGVQGKLASWYNTPEHAKETIKGRIRGKAFELTNNDNDLNAWREEQVKGKKAEDERWNRKYPNPTKAEKKEKEKWDKEWQENLDREYMKKHDTTQAKYEKQLTEELIKEKESIEKAAEEKVQEYKKQLKKEEKEREKKAVFENVDDRVRDWMDINPKKNPKESALYDYAGGTQIRQFLENIKDVSGTEGSTWQKIRDVDWTKGVGAAVEAYGNATKEEEGSRWTPLVGAAISGAKKWLGVTNPWLKLGMDAAAFLTTPLGQKAVKWVGNKAMDVGEKVYNKLAGKDLSREHNEGVIPIFQTPPKPIEQKPIDYSGVNIPNLLPQESNAAYMMRMTGGMNVGPANANVPTYSGYRKPQYEKVQNRVMMAPPKIVVKTPAIRKKMRVKVKRRKAK